jgi:hypothetical protein
MEGRPPSLPIAIGTSPRGEGAGTINYDFIIILKLRI